MLGAARSGTTMLADLIGAHPEVAYWVEPRYVWQYRRPVAPDDVRTAAEATPEVVGYIRGRFARFLRRSGRGRFAEKTPSNCFRVPFVDAVLPDALYVHIVRDGRDVAFSARRKWTAPPVRDAVWRRLTSFEYPLRDVPAYALQMARMAARNPWMSREWTLWGPRYPGIRRDRTRRPLLEVCALQWWHSETQVRRGLAEVERDRVITLRFEEVLASPRDSVDRLMSFLGLEPGAEPVRARLGELNAGRTSAWRAEDAEEVAIVEEIAGPLLDALGYG